MRDDSARSGVPVAEAEIYDFGRSATLAREHVQALESGFETFARQWAAQLSTSIRGQAQVVLEEVALQSFDEYAHTLPSTTTLVVAAHPDSDARIAVQFPLSAAIAWIVPMLGGRVPVTAEDRVLTAIEQALVRSLMDVTLEHLVHAMGGVLPAGMAVTGMQYSPHFTQIAAAADPVLVARLSLRLAGRSLPASVMLPTALVRAGLSSAQTVAQPADPALLRRQVEHAPVDLALRLTPRAVRPDEVLDLAVGDLLALPHAADRPLDLVVGDHVIGGAAVGSSGARLACVVTAIVPEPAEESA